MGVVYEAEQVSLGRRVALKVLPFAAAIDPRQRQRFQIEAQAAAQLHHPHIVPIFSIGCDQGIHYYVMQFVDGRSLAAVLDDLRDGLDNALVCAWRTPGPLAGLETTETATPLAAAAVDAAKSPAVTRLTQPADPCWHAPACTETLFTPSLGLSPASGPWIQGPRQAAACAAMPPSSVTSPGWASRRPMRSIMHTAWASFIATSSRQIS